MDPVIALVGRPNVGKSTLFNRLTKSRDALVADQPGLTRDRKYGRANIDGKGVIVVDTGGLDEQGEVLESRMASQAWQAVGESNLVFFLVDAKEGMMAADQEIAIQLRKSTKKIFLIINKVDGSDPDLASAEFAALGFSTVSAVSASQGRGIKPMLQVLRELLPDIDPAPQAGLTASIKISVIGRPNVGKSTLINRILGEERVIVLDMPGTTRDSIYIPFARSGQDFTLIDTAGIRRRAKTHDTLEKFSIIKALQAMEASQVVVVVLDAHAGISDQDIHLIGFAVEAGKAIVILVNKWDGLKEDERDWIKSTLRRKLSFLDFAETRFVSALNGSGLRDLFSCIERAYRSAIVELKTSELNDVLEQALQSHSPKMVRGRRIKLRYAHQGGKNPPRIVIHGNQTQHINEDYKRYLERFFRKALQLVGTPVNITFKEKQNPYKGQKNKLTARQMTKRRRLKQFVNRK